MMYVIGVYFTAELLAKAAYEETVGRISILMSKIHQSMTFSSVKMAQNNANFLHQIPWYKYDFLAARAELKANNPKSLRNKEYQFALGVEFRMKSQYAKAITKATEASGQAKLTIRIIVHDISVEDLLTIKGVNVINATSKRTEIQTPSYTTFTKILQQIVVRGGHISEIAGNYAIMVKLTGLKRPDVLPDLIVLESL